MSTRPTSLASYFAIYALLVGLAALSLLYSVFHAPAGLLVSMVIASAKAAAVLWIFMHLREQKISSALAIGIALLWILLLGGIMVADVITRKTFPERPRPAAEDGFYQR